MSGNESLVAGRSLVRWSATTPSGDPVSGLALAADFHEASRAAVTGGADRSRLVRVHVASTEDRLGWSQSEDTRRSERRAGEQCGALWHVSGDSWARVRAAQRGAV